MASQSKLTTGGQITVPAHVRKRWQTERVTVEDRGDHLIVRPMPEDRAARVDALRGILNLHNRTPEEQSARYARALKQLDEEEALIERERWGPLPGDEDE